VKIIDDDASAFIRDDQKGDEGDLYATNEEAPQIVGIIDERSSSVIMKQEYELSGKWKSLNSHKNENEGTKREFKKRQISEESPISLKKNSRHSDESPPRKNRRHSDESPPRKSRRHSDESPPRKSRRHSDESPPRKSRHEIESHRRDITSQELPIKIKRERLSSSPSNYYLRSSKSPEDLKRNIKIETDCSPTRPQKMSKTLDGKSSGLQNAKSLKEENEKFRQRQEKLFKQMKPEVSGKNSDVVIRDRKGRNKEYSYDLEKEHEKMKLEEARKKEYDRWGKGLKQLEQIEKRRHEYQHEASKPLSRSADDNDLQDYLKNQERTDDPMLQYIRRKRKEENRKKGVVEKPEYTGDFPDNRFNIRPGYRWDGVDRSNGYEKKYFSMINSKKSLEEEAYRYSTEDM
jgi:pre-mRNA-splicing factor CWC26